MIHFENYFSKKTVRKFLSQEIHYQSCSLREENFKIHNSNKVCFQIYSLKKGIFKTSIPENKL